MLESWRYISNLYLFIFMKTLSKNTYSIALATIIAVIAFFAVTTSVLAGSASFAGGTHATLRASNWTDCPGCYNWQGSASADPGDVAALGVYYKNTGSDTAQNVRIKLTPKNSSSKINHSFSATVSASNASSAPGSASIDVSSEQALDFNGFVELQTPPGNNTVSVGNVNDIFGSGMLIGNVPPGHQGGLVVHFDVGEEFASNDLGVITKDATSITTSSAKLNGEWQGDDVDTWFDYISENDGSSSDLGTSRDESTPIQRPGTSGDFTDMFANISGLSADTTYYFQACVEDSSGEKKCDPYEQFTTDGNGGGTSDDPINVETLSEDYSDGDDFVTLNGEVTEGNSIEAWFVISDEDQDETPACSDSSYREDVSGSYDDGDAFDLEVGNLEDNTKYYFRACGEANDGTTDEGSLMSFTTGEEEEEETDELDVTTNNASGIDDDRATLEGEYENADNADIFFVWGEDESDIDDVSDFDEIDDIRDRSQFDEVDVEIVDENVDGDDSSVSKRVTGLDEDTRYYFRLCAEQDGTLECGNVKSFTTDGARRDNDDDGQAPSAGACSAINVGITNATLRGNYNSDSSVNYYFRYGRTAAFGSRSSTVSGNSGDRVVTQLISGLSANTAYFCEMFVENSDGSITGDIGVFRTTALPVIPGIPVTAVVTSTPSSGAGAFVILEIDDEQETATRGEVLQYEVTWNNVSGRDLDEVALFIKLPKAARFISTTDGTYNQRDHAVYEPLGNLREDDEGEMTITVRVGTAREGEPIVAEAVLAFENPDQGNAFLNAIELDADTYTTGVGLTAGLFGFGMPTTLLGWLLFVLVLALILLAVRYFYLHERDRRYYRRSEGTGPYNPRN